MVDIIIPYPGHDEKEVENQLLFPVEKRLGEIHGIRYLYGTAYPNMAMVIARFKVGHDPEEALLKIYQKFSLLEAELPKEAQKPIIHLKTIDDVPVLAFTLTSPHHTHGELYDYAEELALRLKSLSGVGEVQILGGEPEAVLITLDPAKLQSYFLSPLQVWQNLSKLNQVVPAGTIQGGKAYALIDGGFRFQSLKELTETPMASYMGKLIPLRKVAQISRQHGEGERFAFYLDKENPTPQPAVTLQFSKQKGVNAVSLVKTLQREMESLKKEMLPTEVAVITTRDYGYTAKEKSNELLEHMFIATIAVVLLMGITLGIKEAVVVLLAIPVTLALTLLASYLYGYTLNRVTLFALIFSIGILVDDAIVVVENMHRHLKLGWGKPLQVAAYAVDEVGNPTILATFTVMAALLPMAFVSGLMGPYMRPIPINASSAMLFSLIIAFSISPWLAYRLLKGVRGEGKGEPLTETEVESRFDRVYRKIMLPVVKNPLLRSLMLGVVVLLLIGSIALLLTRSVKVKMLPFDNKSEFQVLVDMPEGTPPEKTAEVLLALSHRVLEVPEVENLQVYVGTHSPINFNGLVRHYDMRQTNHLGDIQVNLLPKHERERQSHAIASSLRGALEK